MFLVAACLLLVMPWIVCVCAVYAVWVEEKCLREKSFATYTSSVLSEPSSSAFHLRNGRFYCFMRALRKAIHIKFYGNGCWILNNVLFPPLENCFSSSSCFNYSLMHFILIFFTSLRKQTPPPDTLYTPVNGSCGFNDGKIVVWKIAWDFYVFCVSVGWLREEKKYHGKLLDSRRLNMHELF
jgi:hypothetical protein